MCRELGSGYHHESIPHPAKGPGLCPMSLARRHCRRGEPERVTGLPPHSTHLGARPLCLVSEFHASLPETPILNQQVFDKSSQKTALKLTLCLT